MRLKQTIAADHRMTVGSVTSFSVRNVFKNLDSIFQWSLVFTITLIAMFLPIGAFIFYKSHRSALSFSSYIDNAASNFGAGDIAAIIVFVLLMIILSVVAGLYTYALFIRSALDLSEERKRGFGERFTLAIKEGFKLFPAFMLLFVINLVIELPYLVASIAWQETHEGIQMLIYLATILLQFWVYAKLSPMIPMILDEQKPVMTAFKEALALTKGQVFRIFGYKIVNLLVGTAFATPFIIVLTVLVIVAVIPVSIGGGGENMQSLIAVISVIALVGYILYILVIGIVYAITYSCDVAIYKGLLKEKAFLEGTLSQEEPVDIEIKREE